MSDNLANIVCLTQQKTLDNFLKKEYISLRK